MNKWPINVLGLLYFVYFVSLQGIYQYGIAPRYGYAGFVDELNLDKFFIALVMVIAIAALMKDSNRLSDLFLNIAFALIVVPSLVIFAGTDLPFRFPAITVFGLLVMIVSAKLVRAKTFKMPALSENFLLFILLVAVSLGIGGVVALGGLRYWNLDISKVYEFRSDASGNLPGIFGYILSIIGKTVIPFGMVLALNARRWFVMFVFAGMSLMLFGLTANKALILYPVLVYFFFFAARSPNIARIFIASLCTLLLISVLDLLIVWHYDTEWSGWFTSLLIRRALFVPSLLNWEYIDYFSSADKYFWANSKVSFGLVSSPHHLNMANLIGQEYFGRAETSANTGWIGSGYANAGLVGVALYSVLAGALLAFLDKYSNKVGAQMVIAAFIVPFIVLATSTDLTTVFLTHGLIAGLLILALLGDRRLKSKKAFL